MSHQSCEYTEIIIGDKKTINAVETATTNTTDAILPPKEEDWARDARKGPRILMSLRVDSGPMA